ncbi:DNA methyltransferase [Altererythrobacter sp. TH136]|uniref:TRM11 family SAM-dependent methyltransferase n=1 Tax=Altererythrobacter sp. TH136 TaxID=2067415 RepID=UPI0011644E99|nr:DNA methyltransferase [Altererythrobacter sp. TH136]QDM40651.1 site-specific DNA-methyltransferase [Altererythrobacter sp. TH136]
MSAPGAESVRSKVLNADWNFWNTDTGYLTHSAHRYSGKFIPQIARQAIEFLSSPGDLIVDPYCGSGTTLVEAGLAGRRAIGIDMNPLAVLIASVKITPVELASLKEFGRRMRATIAQLPGEGLFAAPTLMRDEGDARLDDPWFRKWFQPQVLRDLIAIHNSIMEETDARLQNIGLTAFSDILRRASNAHQGYPNVMFDKRGGERPRPGRYFLKAIELLIERVGGLSQEGNWGDIHATKGDARNLSLSDKVAQAVVTHPPYVGSIPYAEYGTLSLTWLGYDHKALDRELTGGQRQSRTVLDRFTNDYARMIAESYRITLDGGFLFVLVGNPTIKGQLIDLTEMTRKHAEAAGYAEVAIAVRSAENRRANKMGDETLLTFRRA